MSVELYETTLMEIQDYINYLDEQVGLKPETMQDVEESIKRYKRRLKWKNPKYNEGA